MARLSQTDLTKPEFKAALDALGFACLGPTTGDICVYLRELGRSRRRPPNVPVVRGNSLSGANAASGKRARRTINYRATVEACRSALMRAERTQAAADAERDRQAAIAATIAPQALPPARSTLKGADAIHQLADDCLTMKAGAGHVLFKDLMSAGWTRRQIFTHAEAARGLADIRENGALA